MGISRTSGNTQADIWLFKKGIIVADGNLTFQLETGNLIVDSISGVTSGVNFLDGLTASAPISGSLDSNIIATTQTGSDNSTKVATTEFVQDAVATGGFVGLTPSLCAKWDGTYTTLSVESGDWETAVTRSLANEADITNIAGTSGLWDSAYTTVYANSASWSAGGGGGSSFNSSAIAAASANWNSVYNSASVVATNSAVWAYVAANSATIFDDLTVHGSISAQGNLSGENVYVEDTIYSKSDHDTKIVFSTDQMDFWAGGQRLLKLDEGTTDEVVVGDGGDVNFRVATQGFGYNLYVKSDNVGGVDNSVGIRVSSPQAVLHVAGDILAETGTWPASGNITAQDNISAQGIVYALDGNSTKWNSVYSNVNVSSGDWVNTQTTVNTNSAQWGLNTADLANVIAASGAWNSTNTSVNDNSANWVSTYSTVNSNSSNWNEFAFKTISTTGQTDIVADAITDTLTLSGMGDIEIHHHAGSDRIILSAGTGSGGGGSNAQSQSTFTTVSAGSAKWWSGYNTVSANSAVWDAANSVLISNSGNWNNTHTAVYPNSANWSSGYDRKVNGVTFDNSNGILTLTLQQSAVTVDLDDRWAAGTGTAGYIPTWGATAYTLGQSNIYSTGSRAGINTTASSFALLVSGAGTGEASISARDIIYGGPSNSDQWFSVFSTTNATSADWHGGHTTLLANSAAWASTNTTVHANSATWSASAPNAKLQSVFTTVSANSATWNAGGGGSFTSTELVAASSRWNTSHTLLTASSAGWAGAYTWVHGNSASWSVLPTNSARWNTSHTTLTASSAGWLGAYTWVNSNSASWSVLPTNSARWNTAYTTLTSKSANWENTYTIVNGSSAKWWSAHNTLTAVSADWVSVTSTVNSTSSHWSSGGTAGTTLQITSGDWESTNTTVFNNSASWSYSLSSKRIAFAVTTTNTFSAGEVIRKDGTIWNRGTAYLPASADTVGVVQAATSAAFTYIHSGELNIPSHGFTIGSNVFLDATSTGAGKMTETDASEVGTVSKPIGVIIDASNILIQPMRGMVIASSLSSLSAGGWVDAGTSVHTTSSGDNVGIGGVTNPGEKLTVRGNISASGTIYGSELEGVNSLQITNITATGSIYTSTIYDHGHGNTIVPNFSASNLQKAVITGGATINNTSAKAVGGSITLRMSAYNVNCGLTFNSDWIFIGTKPAVLPANKYGILSLQSFGSAESDIIASFGLSV
jgi:hypothetical protein